jgi:2-polyprenyl-3-methyl-5-hydroxy-6-metoxy-1,4-benzoquinol methylase
MPDYHAIEAFYNDNFYTSEGSRFNATVEKIRELIAYVRTKGIHKLAPEGKTLLDFGAGAGHFGKVMEKAGWRVVNVDISNTASGGTKNSRLTMDADRPILDFPDNSFDVVTLWYVIEHMRNPRKVLEEMKRVLRPKGILLLAQQNFNSYQARYFGTRWLILDPPRHLYQFSPENLRRLTEHEGFQCIAIDHESLEMGPFTILQSTLNTLIGNRNYLFRYLKDRRLKVANSISGNRLKDTLMVWISLGFALCLFPLSIAAYYILLYFGSGDVFTFYASNEK